MDPNQKFSELLDAILRGDIEHAQIFAKQMANWIQNGGYVPQALTDARVNQGPREVSIDDHRSGT